MKVSPNYENIRNQQIKGMFIHFIAIGGSVMHQLAIALKRKGYTVSGSDDEIFEPASTNLANEGLLPKQLGWFPDKLGSGIDAIILGMHARQDNPELLRATLLGLKIYSFPEYIFEESKQKTRVAIGGSHGKTTTTAMIMHVLQSAGTNYDYLIGAQLEGFSQSVKITTAPLIICEADEYPASSIEPRPKFLFLHPHIAVLTGIAWDHINVFPTFDVYLEQFERFIQSILPGGVLIFNHLDNVLRGLIESKSRSDIKYVPYSLPTYFIEQGKTEVIIDGEKSRLKVFGNHNLLNLNAAWYVCRELKISSSTFIKSISTFSGASKRLELLASNETCNIYRDFAHAPSKVMATIAAINQQFPTRKLVAILELHTYSSLNANFMTEYQFTMEKADEAIVFFSAHSVHLKRMPQLPLDTIIAGFSKPGLLIFTEKNALEFWLTQQEYSNKNLVFMSSGTYDGLDLRNLLSKLKF